MLGFLDTRVSTLAGIIILLLITGAVGAMIFYQLHQIMSIRFSAMELIL